MNILVISQYFYPENFRINQLCIDLTELGHNVTVLTGKPNYPKGEYYEGYTFNGKEDEIWNNISILRAPLRARKQGAVNLARNYLSFVYQANKRIDKIEEFNYDLIFVFQLSPVTSALPAIKVKNKTGIPVIMYVQDLWPESVKAVTGIDNYFVNTGLGKLVSYIYDSCDLILGTSPSFVKEIQKRVKDKSKVRFWPQYATISKSNSSGGVLNKDKFNITFTGNIGEAQGLEMVIEAARQLKHTNIHWNFFGEGRNKAKLEAMCKEYDLYENVSFHGYVEEKEIPNHLNDSDAALLILKPDPIFDITIPAKLQTYLACGVPVLGCVNGEAKRIITEGKCGLVSETIDTDSLVKTCLDFLNLSKEEMNEFRKNSLLYGIENFNKNNLLNTLQNYMEELTK